MTLLVLTMYTLNSYVKDSIIPVTSNKKKLLVSANLIGDIGACSSYTDQ